MILNWLKYFHQKIFHAKVAIFLLFLSLSSCTDQGCIEADDFGEYETQTIEVSANDNQTNCDYDQSKPLTDTSQGRTVRTTCFTTGDITVYDDNGVPRNPTDRRGGCQNFTDPSYKALCAALCVEQCLASTSAASSPEPNWQSTDEKVAGRNSGVTIRPGAQIIIRAVGSIVLGNSANYPEIYVSASNVLPHAKKSNWSDLFFDVRSSQTITLSFSGEWNDLAPSGTIIGSGSSATNVARAINGGKKLAVYLIPHPLGYDFDYTRTSEQAGSKVVPLLPDPAAWQCSYSGATLTQSTCGHKTNSYTSIGYTNVDNIQAATAFPVSSDFKTTTLSSYGGVIRWTGDGLESSSNFNPFSGVTCDAANGTCSNLTSIPLNTGRIYDPSSATIPNTTYPYEASFKSLAGNSSCNANITATVTSSADVGLYSYTIAVNDTSWSSPIPVEKDQKLVITPDAATSMNCKKMVAVRFNKYHDITMAQSGYVKFTALGGSTSTSCTINGRIINPTGSHTGGSAADFYEYDKFGTTPSTDPFDSLGVNGSPSSITSSTNMNWSRRVFVRKGQVIRFSPSSWNGTWTTESGVQRQCGIGMAMVIEPRPALLCPNTITDYVDNQDPRCAQDNATGTLVGCQAIARECGESGSYCPQSCQKTISCTPGVYPYFQKTSCSRGATVNNSTECAAITNQSSFNCSACENKLIENASLAAKVDQTDVWMCYDLENYKGKVANLPTAAGTTRAAINTFLSSTASATNPATAKGAIELRNFNGSYGNFESFARRSSSTNPSELEVGGDGNIVYQLRSALTFINSGRLRFFVLDGGGLNKTATNSPDEFYSNNSPPGSAYTGHNGFKIKPSGTLEFSNGQWLQAKLCEETRTSAGVLNYACKTFEEPLKAGGATFDAPEIIKITAPTTLEQSSSPPNLGTTSNYVFDAYGNLLRTTSWITNDCVLDPHGLVTTPKLNYYCHTYRFGGTAAQIKDLRLTFKILDPEFANCQISAVPAGGGDNNNNENTPTGTATRNPALWDGIIANNPNYLDRTCTSDGVCTTVTANVGKVCGVADSSCQREFYCANKYSNNTGKYYVNIKVKNPVGSSVSNIISGVITPIVEVMDGKPATATTPEKIGQAERLYKLLIADSRYKAILNMCLVVMFTFYGMGFLMGVSELNHSELINRVIKIGLIYLFVGETGWYWFDLIVVNFFKNSTDQIAFMMASSFDDSPEIANAIANNAYYDKSILFGSVDKVFGMFFSQAVQKKISALLFASIFGWAYLLIIYKSFLLYVSAVANAVLIYLTAQVFISILFTLGPIFFIFTLFKQTKEMFDAWVNHLISFSLQQIFLLTTLAFFNMLMYEVIKMSLGFKICWEEVWTINIITPISLLSFWTVASLPPRTDSNSNVGNIGNPEGIPSLFSILFIWVIASLMSKFITLMTDLAKTLASGSSATGLAKGIADVASAMKKKAGSLASAGWKKFGGEKMVQRLDQKLFDSGALADKAREDKKKSNAADMKNKSALSSAANSAMSDYKKNNAATFAGMSEKRKTETLNKVKQDAMKTKAKELGIKDEDLERLKNSKGSTYVGDNLFGAGLHMMKQGVKSGGTLRASLDDKAVNTKMSHGEAKAAMGKMSKEDRAKFIQAAKDGEVSVDKKKTDKVIDAIKATGRATERAIFHPMQSTKSAFRGAKNAFKSAGSAVLKATIYDAEFNKAESELVAEGKIEAMRSGTKWARTDQQKQDIRARQKENAKKKEAMLEPTVSADAFVQLEREDAYQDEITKIDASGDRLVSRLGQKASTWANRKTANSLSKKGKAKKAEALKSVKQSAAGKLKAKLASATEEQSDLAELQGEANKELTAASADLKSYEDSSGITALKSEDPKHSLLKRLRSPEARKAQAQFREKQLAIKALQQDPKFKEKEKRKKEADVAVSRIGVDKQNADTKVKGLKAIKDNLVSATETDDTRQAAQAADTPDIKPIHEAARTTLQERQQSVESDLESNSEARKAAVKERDTHAANAGSRFGKKTPEQLDARRQMARASETIRDLDKDAKPLKTQLEATESLLGKMDKAQDVMEQAARVQAAYKTDSKEYKKAAATSKAYEDATSTADPDEAIGSLEKFADSRKNQKGDLESLSERAFWKMVGE